MAGLNFQTGMTLRRHFQRAVAAAVTFVHVVAATSAWCCGTDQASDVAASLLPAVAAAASFSTQPRLPKGIGGIQSTGLSRRFRFGHTRAPVAQSPSNVALDHDRYSSMGAIRCNGEFMDARGRGVSLLLAFSPYRSLSNGATTLHGVETHICLVVPDHIPVHG